VLQRLSDDQLLSQLRDLTRRERTITLVVLLHLNEVEHRRLHLKLGYPSMFAYCTEGLLYSASAASRRIRTARCLRKFPTLGERLDRGEVNLTTISTMASILTEKNHVDLLERMSGKTQREVESMAAEHQPRTTLRDRVKSVCVAVSAPQEKGDESSSGDPRLLDRTNCTSICAYDRNGRAVSNGRHLPSAESGQEGKDATTAVEAFPTGVEAMPIDAPSTLRVEQKIVVQFAAEPRFMKKVDQIRSLLAFRLPARASFEEVFATVMDDFIERYSSKSRRERRKKRAERVVATSTRTEGESPDGNGSDRSDGGKRDGKRRSSRRPSRHIPARVRDEVLARDGYRCTFVGTDGRRCSATRHLQIDHRVPFTRGGRHTTANLRVLCARHNRLEAERLMGPAAARRSRREE